MTIEICEKKRVFLNNNNWKLSNGTNKKRSDSGWVNRGRCRHNDNRKTSVKMKPKWKEK